MALGPGSRIGAYEVLSSLGAGGMGEVYRAKDTKLGREVALKILPPEFATDPERVARFEREAKTLASLNHPHIAQIYGVEANALVMELVDGDDLAERLRGGAIPIDEALPMARQLIDALEAAHRAGVIHRDLKPANVKVRGDGTVKVLDFGLAKAMDQGSGIGDRGSGNANSPTITTPAMTMRGVILGTAAYMAPEQAKGKAVDRRADIWAFGCVLFEMLTGERTFGGETTSDTLASVIKSEPEWTRLPADTPASIRRLLRHCLAKSPVQRLQDIGDARLEFEEAAHESDRPAAAPQSHARWRWLALTAVAVAIVLAAALIVGTNPAPQTLADPSLLRYTIPVPPTRFFGPANFVMSPDGSTLAYAAPSATNPAEYGSLYLHSLESGERRLLGGVGTTVRGLVWSPDGRALLTNGGGVRIVDAATGAAQQQLVETTGGLYSFGLAWGADRILLRATGASGLEILAPGNDGRTTVQPYRLPDNAIVTWPSFMPDGKRFLFIKRPAPTAAGDICVGRVDAETVRCLGIRTPSNVQYANGHLIYLNGRSLLAQPFDESTASLTGDPIRLAEDVALGNMNLGAFSVSANGRLAYRNGDAGVERLQWFDRDGTPGAAIGVPRVTINIDLSQDGRTLVVADGMNLWITDVTRGVTFNSYFEGEGNSPALSPNGSRVATAAGIGGRVISREVTGGGEPTAIDPDHHGGVVEDWSPDGKWIALTSGWLVSTDGSSKAQRFATIPAGWSFDEVEFSPDSRFVSFNLGRVGGDAMNVYVAPVNGNGERWQVSVNGGVQGRWSHDGRELFYLAPDGTLMAVSVQALGDRLTFSAPRPLFNTGLRVSPIMDQYKVGADGRFLISKPVIPPDQEVVNIVINWPALLKAAGR